MKRAMIFGAGFLLLATAGAGEALAQTGALQEPDTAIQGLLLMIQNSANSWDGRLQGYATSLFWSLAAIQFVITFFPLVMKNADFGEIVGELVRSVLVIGFFAALLMYSRDWASAIVDSFREAGAQASGLGKGLKPGDMFATAVNLAETMSPATWNPITAVGIALSALLVLLCFAFIAAFMFVTLVESYIVINASVLFMGFGGSQWTRDYALAILRYAVSVGAKLFVLTLIVGLIVQSAAQWKAAYTADNASMLTMVGLALVCAYLAKTIPDLIQGLIGGVSPSGGGTIGSMAAMALTGGAGLAVGATAAAATGAASAAGGGAAGGAPSGGLAGLLNNSIMGAGRAGPAGGVSDGISAAARSAGQRTGGGASTSPTNRAGGASAASQAIKHATNTDEGKGTAQKEHDSNAGASGSGSVNTKTVDSAASGSTVGLATSLSAVGRGLGVMSAISVPGMENAAYAGSPAPSSPLEAPSSDDLKGEAAPPDPVNTIQPAADQSLPTKAAMPPKE
ncbi:P-type conjugative transfer protein TrbL [Sphingobium aromaticiconvertens]|uniref:P-type conjugative transfer protein TrbL n=1 Tax=Sphingobium aromaticiconvertens TaxID=365341 RepID=UPI00301A9E37